MQAAASMIWHAPACARISAELAKVAAVLVRHAVKKRRALHIAVALTRPYEDATESWLAVVDMSVAD